MKNVRLSLAWPGVLLVLLCTFASNAHAQTADKAAAEALFRQAKELTTQGRFAEACPKFEASQQLDAGLGTLLHLADCYEKAKKLASAWATFQEAASLAATRGDGDRASIAKVRASALEPELLRLQVDVPAELPPGFELRRNGTLVPRPAFGAPVPVDAGTWLIQATAPGYQPFEASVSLQQSDPKLPYVLTIPALQAEPAPPAAAETPLQASPSGSSSTSPGQTLTPIDATGGSQKTLGLIIGSAGVIAAVVSGIFTVMANSSNENSLKNCSSTATNNCTSFGKRERDDALSQASVATVAAIVGGVGIAAGATLFITAPSDAPKAAMLSLEGQW